MEKPLVVRASSPAEQPSTFRPLSFTWVLALFAVSLGMWIGLLASVQVLLPSQIEAIAPGRKVWTLGAVTAAGAVAAVLAAPLVGALSDRTGWRFGKRRSWVIVGTAFCALALLALPLQSSIAGICVCWVIVHGGVGGISAALCAVVADRVSVDRRGTVFAIVGFAQPLGLVFGTLLVSGISFRAGYLLVAVLVGLLALPYAFVGRDAPVARLARSVPGPAQSPEQSEQPGPPDRPDAAAAAKARKPLKMRIRIRCPRPRAAVHAFGSDFAWACGGRFMAQFATSLATVYLLYFLRDEIKLADPAKGVAVLSLMFTAGIIVVGLVVGRVSDRTGRRKIFVIIAAMLMAGGLAGMALVSTWPVAVVAAAALGGGYGAYLAVDQALVTQVLRSESERGKDLGVMNMAGSAAAAVAPLVAAGGVDLGGYTLLFLLAGVVAVLGGLLIQPIKTVS
ncbi:MFS transporter [Actinomadura sp. KC216]|uniref:MFS transporter n=1 Tax=Actinomadura sp. KC216 TaxID=2530370 RepID=UPI001042F106|nr:MFS transporter [Actinomadura sp. KC216]TDB81851.1 MFS transporter [Actinomadura sp. KC216]